MGPGILDVPGLVTGGSRTISPTCLGDSWSALNLGGQSLKAYLKDSKDAKNLEGELVRRHS